MSGSRARALALSGHFSAVAPPGLATLLAWHRIKNLPVGAANSITPARAATPRPVGQGSGAFVLKAAAIALLSALLTWAAPSGQRIAVSPDGHFLRDQDGKPFFWLADTAWLMFSKLTDADIDRYLEDRRAKGFTVVQVMLLRGGDDMDPDGKAALQGGDPGKPDTSHGYWDRIDRIAGVAADKGITLALVCAWGSVVKTGRLNVSNAEAYAAFLARRFRDRPNIVWILGGDIRGDQNEAVWNLMGRTLKAGDPGHLITFHPFGRTQSSMWFHDAPWLDFNMFQSGHQRYDQDTDSPHRYGEDNWRYASADYALRPAKPVIDGEPSYEGIPQGLHDTTQPYWTDADCRRYAYWSVFAGAAGHTYGDNAVMQFYRPGKDKPSYGARTAWTEAIHDPGSGEMLFLKRLMLSRPYFERVPDQNLIAGLNGTGHDYAIATRGASYALIYTWTGKPVRIRMGLISGTRVRASWYSPRDGSVQSAGEFANQGDRLFTPPGKPADGNDWVLVLDDASKKFPAPGGAAGN